MRRIQNKSGKEEGCRKARLGECETHTEQEWEGDRRAGGRGYGAGEDGGGGGGSRLTDGHRQRQTHDECLAPADDAKRCPWKMAHPAVSVAGLH